MGALSIAALRTFGEFRALLLFVVFSFAGCGRAIGAARAFYFDQTDFPCGGPPAGYQALSQLHGQSARRINKCLHIVTRIRSNFANRLR
jgi:hypothetical protein